MWPGKDRDRARSGMTEDDLRVVERATPATVSGAPSEWRHQLVFGDNAFVMDALLQRHAGQVELIYIDPPFATGLSYFGETGRSGASMLRRVYRDTLEGGMAGYTDTMFERLGKMRELLSDNGKIFVHCDWRANAVLRLVMDELFGGACFRNEIIWRRAPNLGRQAAAKQLGRVYDSILVYSKTEGARFGGDAPRRRALVPLDKKGKPKGARWDEVAELYFTTAPRGDYTDKSIERLRGEGRVYDSSAGKVYIKYFLTKGEDGRWYKEQPVDAMWDDYDVRPLRHRPKSEVMGYDTQKPEGLLERIITWATKPGDLVADFFCGSGTTAAVAQGLDRRWIACDQQRTAIEITRRRLLARGATFDVVSLIRGERRTRIENATAGVLEAFGATIEEGGIARVGDACVLVAPLDQVSSLEDIRTRCAKIKGAVVWLAWEWGDDDAAAIKAQLKMDGVELTMRTIPHDVVRGLSCTAAQFLERPEVDMEVVRDAEGVLVRLVDARCPAPERLRETKSNKGNKADRAVLHWSDYIDTWRVDFGDEDVFTPTWQSVRDGDDLPLTSARHQPPPERIRVKVITVFGDEIDRVLQVKC